MSFKRGELYYAEVLPEETRGHEQHKIRPWAIVSSNRLNSSLTTVIAVPLTTQIRKYQQDARVFRVFVPKLEISAEPGCLPQDSVAFGRTGPRLGFVEASARQSWQPQSARDGGDFSRTSVCPRLVLN